jgi:hypothetical protein
LHQNVASKLLDSVIVCMPLGESGDTPFLSDDDNKCKLHPGFIVDKRDFNFEKMIAKVDEMSALVCFTQAQSIPVKAGYEANPTLLITPLESWYIFQHTHDSES